MTAPRRVAVVGSGVAGLTAAYVASRTADVTLFEADSRLGGHADTHVVTDPEAGELAIDTGFIVHNEVTYPTLLRLFRELGVATQDSEMSMSVRDGALEYAGALGARGLFPTVATLRNPAYLRMLGEIPRFHRRARALLAQPGSEVTLGAFLGNGGFSAYFTRHFMEPLVAAVWSCDPAVALDYPARYLFTFLQHHGMLGVFGSPSWKTVTGGSRQYVERVGAALQDVRTGTKIIEVRETATGVELTDGNGATTTYDAVVIATHPDQALAMLAEPTPAQREVLGSMPYSPNTAQLHTDTSVLPHAERARGSWNFLRRDEGPGGSVTVTYDLTRLMRLPTSTHYLVTLGGTDLVDPDLVIDTMEYAHPLYNPESVAAQARLGECDTERVVFAGAYHGWGFHEDGARSGLAAVTRLGLSWPADVPAKSLVAPRIFDTEISHTRRRPFKRTFRNRGWMWLVDLDDLPDRGVLGRFEARDHLGDPDLTIRENVDRFLDAHGIDLGPRGRVVMAAQARALGHCFNPISVFWCFDTAGQPAATVVEVHNTYGDRHAYLVGPSGRGRVEKQMYVSPFHGTDGWYDVAAPRPTDRLDIAITLHTDDGAVFSAALRGRDPVPVSRRAARQAAPATLRTSLMIRVHGVWLWLRRLPVRPRPTHPRQEGV